MKDEADVKRCGECLWSCRTVAMVQAQHPQHPSNMIQAQPPN